jgi:hypothetical protein
MAQLFYVMGADGLTRKGWGFMINSGYGDGMPIIHCHAYIEEKRDTTRHKFRDVHVGKRSSERPFVEPPKEVVDAFREWLVSCPVFLSKNDAERRDVVCPVDGQRHGRHI